MFVDFAKIYVKAGDGGNGAISFHRERFVPFGGPDGGDGGKGGDIIFIADSGMQTLVDFKYKKKFIAKNGSNGGKNNKFGASADNLIIKVPKGTLIFHSETKTLMAEITSETDPIIIAKGGRGGFGNSRFKNSVRQSPKFAKPGGLGEEFEICLELKLLADVGLIGFPNVGKSTLISVISAAKPKIGNYPFTTITPVLGVVKVNEGSFVVADLPGLIKGASKGAGLGIQFLKHVQKCRILVHVVDVSIFSQTDAINDVEAINLELKEFGYGLIQKEQVIVASKVDAVNSQKLEDLKRYAVNKKIDFYEISAATNLGLDSFVKDMYAKLKTLPEVQPEVVNYVPDMAKKVNNFKVDIEDNVYYVEAPWLERIMLNSKMDSFENLQYFQMLIKRTGIENELKRKGIKPGDMVNIHGFYFEYFE